MKKIKAFFLALSVASVSLSSSSLFTEAQDVLVLTRTDTSEAELSILNSDQMLSVFEDDEHGTVYAGEHGEVLMTSTDKNYRLLVVTDSNGFQPEFIERPWLEEFSDYLDDWMHWEEITPDAIPELYSKSYSHFAGYQYGSENWFEQYAPDSRFYSFTYSRLYLPEVEQIFREDMLQFDGIRDVVYMNVEWTRSLYWIGDFQLAINEDYEGLYTENGINYAHLPDELTAYMHEKNQIYLEWNAAYTDWINSIDADSMTPAQLELSRKEAGIASDYEMMQIANDACEWILTEYSDIFHGGVPYYSFRSSEETISPVSVWENVGDVDEDGKVTASDAALVLQAAADQGAGRKNDVLNEEQLRNADVNADYTCNASDAALILAYAAQHGAGNAISFPEMIRNAD